jgi:spermidine synthase
MPSFGEWGYVIATKRPFIMPERFMSGLRFITPESAKTMMEFPPDMGPVDADVNKLNNQALVRYFEEEWAPYVH